ncbi:MULTISPECIES: hypothetical protein [Natrialba]|nr:MULTISPECIES: hypothetical protein [Natrialba]
MTKLSHQSQDHLERALQTDDPSEKDFYVRQVIQAEGVDHLPIEPAEE